MSLVWESQRRTDVVAGALSCVAGKAAPCQGWRRGTSGCERHCRRGGVCVATRGSVVSTPAPRSNLLRELVHCPVVHPGSVCKPVADRVALWLQENLSAVRDMRDALLAEYHRVEVNYEREVEQLLSALNTTDRTVNVLNRTLGT